MAIKTKKKSSTSSSRMSSAKKKRASTSGLSFSEAGELILQTYAKQKRGIPSCTIGVFDADGLPVLQAMPKKGAPITDIAAIGTLLTASRSAVQSLGVLLQLKKPSNLIRLQDEKGTAEQAWIYTTTEGMLVVASGVAFDRRALQTLLNHLKKWKTAENAQRRSMAVPDWALADAERALEESFRNQADKV